MQNLKTCFFLLIFSTFTCPLLANETVNLSSLELLEQQLTKEQGKIIYIDFWASWCIPCRKSFPWMNDLKAQYETKGLTIISINLDHSRALADEFLMKTPANFQVIYDPKGLIARKYKLQGMPSSFIVNRQGEIVSAHVGFNQEKKLTYEQELKALITSEPH
ncbi:MAG: TlpA disulfide reductase family protein [Cognaticolwellia sp.]